MVLERFWNHFSWIFWFMFENNDFLKNIEKHRFVQCFVRLELLQICSKTNKNPSKIDASFEWEKQGWKIASKLDPWYWYSLAWIRSKPWSIQSPLRVSGLLMASSPSRSKLKSYLVSVWTLCFFNEISQLVVKYFKIKKSLIVEAFSRNFGNEQHLKIIAWSEFFEIKLPYAIFLIIAKTLPLADVLHASVKAKKTLIF